MDKNIKPSDMNKILSRSRLTLEELSIVKSNLEKRKSLMERLKDV